MHGAQSGGCTRDTQNYPSDLQGNWHFAKVSGTHRLPKFIAQCNQLQSDYGTNFLHLFAFFVSRPPQSALLHRQALTLLLNRWLACLTESSILVLKLTFSPDPFPRNLPISL